LPIQFGPQLVDRRRALFMPEIYNAVFFQSISPMSMPVEPTDVEYAGFWVRTGATLIDTLLIMLITFPLLVSIYGWGYFDSKKFIVGPADFLISWVLPAIAVIWFWTQKQATPGKAVLSLRVVDADSGANLSIGQCIGRYLGYFVSIIPMGLGLIWIGFDRKKQGWHDKLACAVVVGAKNHGPDPVRFPHA